VDAISQLLSTYVLNALWQIPLVAATAWFCVKFASRLSAKYHHALWVAALLLSLVMPFASLERLNVFRESDSTSSLHLTSNDGHALQVQKTARADMFLFGMRRHSQRVFLAPTLKYALAVFYVGFIAYRLLILGMAWRRTLQLKAGTYEAALPRSVQEAAKRAARHYSLPAVAIRSSWEATGPFILGARHPILVLPEGILREAQEADLSSILNHEMAHLKRHDFLLNLIYEVLCLPVAFHPVTGVLKERIDQSRELACDEMAAEQTDSPTGYARSLLRIAQSMSPKDSQTQSSHALGLFDTNNLEERIMSLLAKKNRIGKRWGRFFLVGVATILAVVCAGISGYSFQVSTATDQTFFGTWRAEYHGKNFMVISLREEKGKMSGSIRMMNTRINLEGEGEVYDISGELSEPMNLTNMRSDGKAMFFDFLEEGDTDPVHWRMELTAPGKASVHWIELPQGLKFKPIPLARDAAR
jgi:beta-lactamase regulating signal transducer with metallopeptidase domain